MTQLQNSRIKFFVINFLAMLTFSSCSDSFERSSRIEGIYYPNGYTEFSGSRAVGSDDFWEVHISKPVRVTEIGMLRIGLGADWGRKSCVALVVCQDRAYYIDTTALASKGKLEFQSREDTFSEWIHDHSFIVIILLVFIGIILFAIYLWYRNYLEIKEVKYKKMLEEKAIRENEELNRRKLQELKESLRIKK
jgi:hypothetical protein